MRLNFALGLMEEGDLDSAIEATQAAIAALPNEAQFHFVLGELYEKVNAPKKAIAAYHRACDLQDEDRLGAGVRLTLLGVGEQMNRLPADYVEALFDDYAPRFEKNLVKHLGYRAPEQLFDLLFSHLSKMPSKPDILDLGCGTGLAGLHVRPIAGRLEGIDLSRKMLKQAEKKKIYNRLEQKDVLAEIDETAPRFDLVIACDVLNYLGNLIQVFQRSAQRLRRGGFLAFSVESAGQHPVKHGFDLHPGQRFIHNRQHIHSWLSACGFQLIEERFTPIRTENGQPVEGHLVLARLQPLLHQDVPVPEDIHIETTRQQ
jgi:predicted TPR repeat methyltransferase